MIIRESQMVAITAPSTDRCVAFTIGFIRENDAGLIDKLDPADVAARVRDGVDRTERYDLQDFADIATFVYFQFRVASEFDEYPFFQEILTDEELEPGEKISTMVELATDEDWAAASEYRHEAT